MLVADARFRFQLRNCNFEFRGIVSHISSTFSGRCAGDIFGVPKMGRILQKNIFWGPRNGPILGSRNGPILGSRNGPSLLISNWEAHFWTLKWAHFWPPKWAHFWDPKIYFLQNCTGVWDPASHFLDQNHACNQELFIYFCPEHYFQKA